MARYIFRVLLCIRVVFIVNGRLAMINSEQDIRLFNFLSITRKNVLDCSSSSDRDFGLAQS